MHHNVAALGMQMVIETLHHLSGSITEQTALVVIAVGGVALNLKFLPRPTVDSIFLRSYTFPPEQDSYRTAGNLPTADSCIVDTLPVRE